ncbi:NAD(P)-dependent oxidoreductase [Chromobacterium sp. IIBBL 290-4]|uniref:NAD-dependent epimerase/dehydratase family protein n=1 Tax=Chromobacterium sp. IIBBL 290-4 TaxID=2953890 RepID=UPI0020B7C136|nr:NAD(P)-dependent oxidoreductase [Chromobacterium sp. IIBBL 290-4]UTH76707.1 NAD(P)-dependent oxidoreductase [Chromobacterium sp. IIBBL 290-4]
MRPNSLTMRPSRELSQDLDAALGRQPDVWQSLRGASLFISGGTGWFGRWLLETIVHANARLGAGIHVLALSRDPDAFARRAPHLAADPAIRFHRGDVRDFDFPSGHFSHFLHAATTSAHETFQGETPLGKFDTLVTGTRRVLDFAAEAGPEHFLFTSSGAAYGTSPSGMPLREDDPVAPDTMNPVTALGQAKRAAEFLCAAYAQQHGWHLSVARCFAFVGPFMPLDIHYAIGNFIQCALRREPIIIQGDGSPLRSYLYMGDLSVWLMALLRRKGESALFNVGSDEAISIADLAYLVRDRLHPGGEVRILGRSDVNVGNPARNLYVPDIGRARAELGLEPWTSLADAIQFSADAFISS